MPSLYHNYSIEKIPGPLEIGDRSFEEGVLVTFFDALGRELERVRFGKVDKATVYSAIEKGDPVVLDHCYVRDLSFSEYRRKRGIAEEEQVELTGFFASGAFFDHARGTDLSYACFKGERFDLSGACFANGAVSFYKTKFLSPEIDLSGVLFGLGDVDFQFAEFADGMVSLKGAVFGSGDVSFVNTEFGNGNVDLKNVHFGDGKIDLHFARFGKGNISLDGALIGDGRLDMRKIDFGKGRFDMRRIRKGDGDVIFDESEFGEGRVNFRSSCFGKGNLSFKQVQLGKNEMILDRVDLGEGTISFRKMTVGHLSIQDCHLNNYMDLRIERADVIDLSDTVVRDIIDLIPSSSGTHIGELRLVGMRNLGQIFIDWERNDVKRIIGEQQTSSDREKADQFRTLKEGFNNIGQYNSEDKAYVLFMRHDLRAQVQEHLARNRWNALWAYPSAAFKWLVFDKMGLYATDPIRVLTSMLVVYVLFSLSYVAVPWLSSSSDLVSSLGDPDHLNVWEEGFYHSAITFLTIGYGDYYPSGQFRWISSLEGFVGVFLMAYFTVAFVRKILR